MSAFTLNGDPIPVLPASYSEAEDYPADTGVTHGSYHTSPVNAARTFRRTASFQTPFDTREATLAYRSALEGLSYTIGGTLVGDDVAATPASVQLVNHPEVPWYAQLSVTLWLE